MVATGVASGTINSFENTPRLLHSLRERIHLSMRSVLPKKDQSLLSVAPYYLLIIGLCITAIAAFYIHNDVAKEESRRFREISNQVQGRIRNRLERYEDTLTHTRSFFNASDYVSRREFHDFFKNMNLLDRYPGFQAIGYIERIRKADLNAHISGRRRSGFPKYVVWPTYPRPEYFVVSYIEPFDWRNQRTFGFDMATEPAHRAAMDQARDTGKTTLSEKVTLVQETTEQVQPGFLLLIPIYQHKNLPASVKTRRRELKGFIYTPFRGTDLFEKIFEENPSAKASVQFEVYDGDGHSPQRLLYDSNGKVDFGAGRPEYEDSQKLDIAGHRWTIYISSMPAFTSRTSRYATLFVVFAGMAMSILMYWVLMAVKRQADSERRRLQEEREARARVEHLANDLKAAVAERDISLETVETINRVGRVISAELDLEKLVQAVNDAATSLSRAKFGAFFYNQLKPDGETLTLYTISGVPREKFAHFPMPRNTAIFAPTFNGKGIVRIDDVTKDPRYGKNSPYAGMPEGHLPVRSYLAVPVITRTGEVIGGLFLGHPEPGVFGEREERTVVGLAAQAAVAVDNARLYQNAKDAIAARDDFLSICSHELRTPLTSLRLQTQLSRRSLDKNDSGEIPMDKYRRYLDNANSQIDRLVRLVEDMLDIARIRAGKLSLNAEKVELGSLVEEVMERSAAQIATTGSTVEVKVEKGIFGVWDRFRLEQVFVNLLTNALKYGGGKPIEVSAREEDGAAILKVADHGIGIDKESQHKIFERFERAASKLNISGLGLGLFIVRQIVESHGGTIRVESEPGQGSCFTVTLPLHFLAECAPSEATLN